MASLLCHQSSAVRMLRQLSCRKFLLRSPSTTFVPIACHVGTKSSINSDTQPILPDPSEVHISVPHDVEPSPLSNPPIEKPPPKMETLEIGGGILRQLIELSHELKTPQKTLQDSKFKILSGHLDKTVTNMSTPILLDSLSFMLRLTSEDLRIVESLEMQVRWTMRKMTVSQLLKVVQMHNGYETKLRKSVYDEALALLEQRWVELTNPGDLVSILYMSSSVSDKLLSHVEDRALDLCDRMSAKDLYRIMYTMARGRRRNTPLLRALVYHMNKSPLDLSMVHLANLIYACAAFSFYDENLMRNVVERVADLNAKNPEELTIPLCSSFLQSIAILRWHGGDLLDVFTETMFRRCLEAKPVDWCRLVHASAFLDFMPAMLGENFANLIGGLDSLRSDGDPRHWLDFVWSTMVLDQLTAPTASSVLNQEFIASVEKLFENSSPLPAYMKLLNINAVAQTLPDYAGPLLSTTFLQESTIAFGVRQHTELLVNVTEALNSIAPINKYAKIDVKTTAGFVIDIAMLLDDKGDPQPTTRSNAKSDDGLHRVAVKVFDFTDMTAGIVQPTGIHSLAIRHLARSGYKVVQIPYTEYNCKDNIAAKVKYLHGKLREAVVGKSGASSKTSTSSKMRNIELHADGETKQTNLLKKHSTSTSLDSPKTGAIATKIVGKVTTESQETVGNNSDEVKVTKINRGSSSKIETNSLKKTSGEKLKDLPKFEQSRDFSSKNDKNVPVSKSQSSLVDMTSFFQEAGDSKVDLAKTDKRKPKATDSGVAEKTNKKVFAKPKNAAIIDSNDPKSS